MFQKYFTLIALLSVFFGFSQTITFPDPTLKAVLLEANVNNETAKNLSSNFTSIDTNSNGEIEVSEALQINYLYLQDLGLTSISGLEHFKNLTYLNINYNQINTLDITTLTKLKEFYTGSNAVGNLDLSKQLDLEVLFCTYSQLSTLNISGLSKLKSIDCSNNLLTNLDLSKATQLEILNCENNLIAAISFGNNPLIKELNLNKNALTQLSVDGLNQLKTINCSFNKLTNINLGAIGTIGNIEILNIESNQLSTINVSKLTKLKTLNCADNKLTALDVSSLSSLIMLNCENNLIKQMYFTSNVALEELNCGKNLLNALLVSGLVNVKKLDCNNNQLTTLDCSKSAKLEYLYVYNNSLSDLKIQNLNTLRYLNCNVNQLTTLNLSGSTNIETIYVSGNKLTSLDISTFLKLQNLVCDSNKLTNINLKNGLSKNILDFSSNSTLSYICVDDFEWEKVQSALNQLQYTNCEVNSYCTFVPGGNYYTITGATKYDKEKNGCDSSDSSIINQKFTLFDGSDTIQFIANKTPNFNVPVISGSYILSPEFENGTYFDTVPSLTEVTFPNTSNNHIQDQCVSMVSSFSDLEVVMFPTNDAIPGEIAAYIIALKNKGNFTQSGSIELLYDTNAVASTLSTNPSSSKVLGKIVWNFNNLAPFSSNRYIVNFNLNNATSSSPLFPEDIISHQVNVTSSQPDEFPKDNTFILNQKVAAAASSNVLQCLEGETVTTAISNNYIHYAVRYENTGSSIAKNIVIRTLLDTNVFDPTTLMLTESSGNGVTKISKGNQVEFIYENINLPVNAEGYLSFKVKTLPSIVAGNIIDQIAEIYLDTNKRIITNLATTNVETLSNSHFELSKSISLYPNPTKEFLNLKSDDIVEVKKYTIYSLIGQKLIEKEFVKENSIDVTSLVNGNYLIRLTTNKGVVTKMFIKQ